MTGWLDIQMDKWMDDGWMDRQADGWVDGWMDAHKNVALGNSMDGKWMNIQKHRWNR